MECRTLFRFGDLLKRDLEECDVSKLIRVVRATAGVLAAGSLSFSVLAVPAGLGTHETGNIAFDALLYSARDPQLCELPIQLRCRDIPGTGTITNKFYPDSFFLFSLDPASRRVKGGLYRAEQDRLRLLFPSNPSSPARFDGPAGISSWNVESSSYQIVAGGAGAPLKLLFKDVKATQAYPYHCSRIAYPIMEADIRPVGCSSQFFSRKLMKRDGDAVTLPVFHLDRDPNIAGGVVADGNPVDASVYTINCATRSYAYVSRGWLNPLPNPRYTAVDTLPASWRAISESRTLRTLYPEICKP